MTPEEFWYGDPELFYNYSRVHEAKEKEKAQDVWAIGARMIQVLQSTPIYPVGVVGTESLRQLPSYPECPYIDIPKDEMTEEEIEFNRKKAFVHFTNWVNSFKRGEDNARE